MELIIVSGETEQNRYVLPAKKVRLVEKFIQENLHETPVAEKTSDKASSPKESKLLKQIEMGLRDVKKKRDSHKPHKTLEQFLDEQRQTTEK